MAIKVEKQLKMSGTRPRPFPQTSSAAPWKSNHPKKEENQSMFRAKPAPKPVTITTASQGKSAPTLMCSSEIKCFKCQGRGHIASQCPNKRVMVIRENDEIESEDEAALEDMPPLEDALIRDKEFEAN